MHEDVPFDNNVQLKAVSQLGIGSPTGSNGEEQRELTRKVTDSKNHFPRVSFQGDVSVPCFFPKETLLVDSQAIFLIAACQIWNSIQAGNFRIKGLGASLNPTSAVLVSPLFPCVF